MKKFLLEWGEGLVIGLDVLVVVGDVFDIVVEQIDIDQFMVGQVVQFVLGDVGFILCDDCVVQMGGVMGEICGGGVVVEFDGGYF